MKIKIQNFGFFDTLGDNFQELLKENIVISDASKMLIHLITLQKIGKYLILLMLTLECIKEEELVNQLYFIIGIKIYNKIIMMKQLLH